MRGGQGWSQTVKLTTQILLCRANDDNDNDDDDDDDDNVYVSIVWEPIQKRAYSQLVREHSVTVVSAR